MIFNIYDFSLLIPPHGQEDGPVLGPVVVQLGPGHLQSGPAHLSPGHDELQHSQGQQPQQSAGVEGGCRADLG